MKFGFLFSLIIHTFIVIMLVTNLMADLMPDPDIQVMKVKLIAAKEIKKTIEKPKKKIRTQQSAAPKAPPKKEKPQKKVKPKSKTKVISKKSIKQEVLKDNVNKKKQKEIKEDPNKSNLRPDKLDKSEDKKNIVQSKDAEITETPDDDFLALLDFAKDLEKNKKAAQIQSDEETEPTATFEDQQDIAMIKRHIEKNWYKTPGIKNIEDLELLIEMRLNRDGTLVSAKIIKSSGQMFFDNSILRAARRSAPLPFPPEKFDLFRITEIYFNGQDL